MPRARSRRRRWGEPWPSSLRSLSGVGGDRDGCGPGAARRAAAGRDCREARPEGLSSARPRGRLSHDEALRPSDGGLSAVGGRSGRTVSGLPVPSRVRGGRSSVIRNDDRRLRVDGGGDSSAFCTRRHPEVRAWACGRPRDGYEAEDVVQQVFPAAWQPRGAHRAGRGTVRAWPFGTTGREVRDALDAYCRRQARGQRLIERTLPWYADHSTVRAVAGRSHADGLPGSFPVARRALRRLVRHPAPASASAVRGPGSFRGRRPSPSARPVRRRGRWGCGRPG
ncbi:RNA polymerase sigma factor [Streptomyces sp. NPDC012950]|uniref:RNA polymerase sigma factor n=1 Tax=Streptomyces sp. NPDC012950 TaxID=3364858 RepID=UPI0036937B39